MKINKKILIASLLTTTLLSGCIKEDKDLTGMMERIYGTKEITVPSYKLKKFVDSTLKYPEFANSSVYLIASRTAFNLGLVEDAGFLLYAAKMRMSLDQYIGTLGNQEELDVKVALGYSIAEKVNPVVVRNPAMYKSIINRLENWNIVHTEDYGEPWNNALSVGRNEEITKKSIEIKNEFISSMRNIHELLSDPEYHNSLMITQNYNLNLSQEEKELPNHKSDFEAAKKKMSEIIEIKGIIL